MFNMKLLQSCHFRESWTSFDFYEEDAKFCNEKWNAKFYVEIFVIWDNTNFNLKFKSSASHIQTLTHSTYYGRYCAKEGFGKQLCAWKRGVDLWTGGVSDAECFIGELKKRVINVNDDNANNEKILCKTWLFWNCKNCSRGYV